MYGFHFVARLLQGLTTQYFQGNFVSIVYVCALWGEQNVGESRRINAELKVRILFFENEC